MKLSKDLKILLNQKLIMINKWRNTKICKKHHLKKQLNSVLMTYVILFFIDKINNLNSLIKLR